MKRVVADGSTVQRMFGLATAWLEKAVPDINAINVFPVPDGDTGINMLLTMRSAMAEAEHSADSDASSVVQAMSSGALMGARGNSGVILSQFFRGLAKGLGSKSSFDGSDFAKALEEASGAAYEGLVHPVEGTMLTVLKDAAEAARKQSRSDSASLLSVLELATQAAKESVARTPELLPVLREAGVVDAGGQGLYVLLEGALYALQGREKEIRAKRPELLAGSLPLTQSIGQMATDVEVPYGYCTNFVLEGKKLNANKIKSKLNKKGQSLVVTGGDSRVRVHVHSFRPGEILEYAMRFGTLHQIDIKNMDDQYEEFIRSQREKLPKMQTAIVAVASGDGIFRVFNSLGSTIVVPGGQSMNPSVRQLLQAVELAPSDKVILLPNNKNIVGTARQLEGLSSKQVRVVPSRTVPQGIAALLAFGYNLTIDQNVTSMEQAISSVTTVEITRAVRKMHFDGLTIKQGQFIAILDDEHLVASGSQVCGVVSDALQKTNAANAEMVTLYYGAETEGTEAETIAEQIRREYRVDVEVVRGGQLHYNYIISLE